jgi:hypothetical protein
MSIDNESRQQLERRLAEIEEKIANYPHWGAVLTAWDEDRRGIMSALRRMGDGSDTVATPDETR